MHSATDDQILSFLPLKPVVLHILLALAEGDAHGYAVIQQIRERSEGHIRLETGSFYRHLRKLISQELVAEAETRPVDDDPRRGAYYRLTALGLQVLSAEGRRLERLLSATNEMGLLGGESSA